jgi:hypothetical protein
MRKGNQNKEGRVEPGETPVDFHGRQDEPDDHRNGESSGDEADEENAPAELGFAQSGQHGKRHHIPQQVLGGPVSPVTTHQAPELAMGQRLPTVLEQLAGSWKVVKEHSQNGKEQRGAGKAPRCRYRP